MPLSGEGSVSGTGEVAAARRLGLGTMIRVTERGVHHLSSQDNTSLNTTPLWALLFVVTSDEAIVVLTQIQT